MLHVMSLEEYLNLSNEEQIRLNAFWINPLVLIEKEDQNQLDEIEEGIRTAVANEPKYGWLGERHIFRLFGGAKYLHTVELGTFVFPAEQAANVWDDHKWDDLSFPLQNVQFHKVFCVVDVEAE